MFKFTEKKPFLKIIFETQDQGRSLKLKDEFFQEQELKSGLNKHYIWLTMIVTSHATIKLKPHHEQYENEQKQK